MPSRLLMKYWIGIYGIRNLTKEINIRISWQAYTKEEDTKKNKASACRS
jgi:hypothetical protein